MKLSYYGYSFTEKKNNVKKGMSIKEFIKNFCKYNDPTYKNTFRHNNEHIFLLPATGDLYLFIETRNNEIIKKINANDTTVSEIIDSLNQGEMIGFASYVYISDSYLGFASTSMAPRIHTFGNFIDEIFVSLNITDHEFTIIPFLIQSTRADAMAMPFIGRSTIQINKSNKLFDDLVQGFCGKAEEFEEVESFEIILKPRNRKDISKAAKRILNSIPDEGIEKLILKAKDDLHPVLIDLYLAGKGLLSDNINIKDEHEIATTFRDKIQANPLLSEKVNAHEQDESIKKETIASIDHFRNLDAWSNSLLDLHNLSQ